MDITQRVEAWCTYLASLPWQRGQLDPSSHCAFLRAASLGVDASYAIEKVSSRIQAAGDVPREGKLRRQLRNAFEYVGKHPSEPGFVHRPQQPKMEYRPEKLAEVAAGVGSVDEEYLAARSKFTAWNRSPAGFLHKLFQPGERVVIFNVFESQGCVIWQHPGITGDLSTLDWLRTDQQNVWFLCNPVDGAYRWNPRQQKQSRRSEESVTSFRFAVIESDKAPRELWLRALVRLPLPISAITESGGDSIHALVRIDAGSKAEWDETVCGDLKGWLRILGADPGALRAVQLTRLANCVRGQTGRLQRLLYLDDDPSDCPICEIAPRQATRREAQP